MSQGRLVPSARFLKLLGAGAVALLLVPIWPEVGFVVIGFDLLLVVFLLWDAGTEVNGQVGHSPDHSGRNQETSWDCFPL